MAAQRVGQASPFAARGRAELLRLAKATCPRCQQSWLVVGVRQGGAHACKSCGCEFVVALAPQEASADRGMGL